MTHVVKNSAIDELVLLAPSSLKIQTLSCEISTISASHPTDFESIANSDILTHIHNLRI